VKQLLGIVLILGVGLMVSNRWFGRAKLKWQARFFYLTGEEFLLVGLLLGPLGTNLIDIDTMRSLEPFVGLGLGYIGFVFGMQFSRSHLVAVPRRYYAATTVKTLVSTGVLLLPLYLGLEILVPENRAQTPLVLALAATAVGTSTSFLFLLDRQTQVGRSEVFRFMRFSSVFDDLWGVLLFGFAVCLLRSGTPLWYGGGDIIEWLALSLTVGVVSGGALLITRRMNLNDKEVLLFLLGTILFSGGLAAYLRLSPIFTNLVAGALFCNLSRQSEAYHEILLRVEKPIYLFMLVLAGAMWTIQMNGLLLMVLLYAIFRTLGKLAGGRAAVATLSGAQTGWSRLGLGLTAQSEMAVAMMVNLLMLYDDGPTRLVVSTVFVAVVVNDLISSAYFSYNYKKT
jgi:hypothetical protein